jgi:hypothetical protein
LRKSGRADLYYNYQMVQQTEEVFEDIQITPFGVYLKKFSENGTSFDVYKINALKNFGDRFTFDMMEHLGIFNPEKWDLIGSS